MPLSNYHGDLYSSHCYFISSLTFFNCPATLLLVWEQSWELASIQLQVSSLVPFETRRALLRSSRVQSRRAERFHGTFHARRNDHCCRLVCVQKRRVAHLSNAIIRVCSSLRTLLYSAKWMLWLIGRGAISAKKTNATSRRFALWWASDVHVTT